MSPPSHRQNTRAVQARASLTPTSPLLLLSHPPHLNLVDQPMAYNAKWAPDSCPPFFGGRVPAMQYRQHPPQFAQRPFRRSPAQRQHFFVNQDDSGHGPYSWRAGPALAAAGPSHRHAPAAADEARRGRSPTRRIDRPGRASSPPARRGHAWYPPGSSSVLGLIVYTVPGMPPHRSRSPSDSSFQYVCRLSLPTGYLVPILRGPSDSRRDELRKNAGLAFLRFEAANETAHTEAFVELIGSLSAIEHCARAVRTTLGKDVESGRVHESKLGCYRWTRMENASLMPLCMNREAFHLKYKSDGRFWEVAFARFEQDERAKVAARIDVAPPQPEPQPEPPVPAVLPNTNVTPIGPRVVHPPENESSPPPPNPTATTRSPVKFTLPPALPKLQSATRDPPPSLLVDQHQSATDRANQHPPQRAVVPPQLAPQPQNRQFAPQHTILLNPQLLQLRQPLPPRPVQPAPARAADRYERHSRDNAGQPFANYRPSRSRSNSPGRAPLRSRIQPPPLTARVGERASSAPLEHRSSTELPSRPSRLIAFMEPEAYDRIIPYPAECTAAVIGSKGSVILEMQEATGARCRVVKFNNPGLFCVSGTDREIDRAARMLEDAVQSKAHVRGWRVGDTAWDGLGEGTDRTLSGWKRTPIEHRAGSRASRSRSRSCDSRPASDSHEARESQYVPRSPRQRSSSRTRSRSRSGSPRRSRSRSHSPYIDMRRRTHSPASRSGSPRPSFAVRDSFSPAPISSDPEPFSSTSDLEPFSPTDTTDSAPTVTNEHRAALDLLRSLPASLRVKEWGTDPLVEPHEDEDQIDYDEGPLPFFEKEPKKLVEHGERACIVAYYAGPDDSEDKVQRIVKALVGDGKRGRAILFKDDDDDRSVKRQRVAS